MRFRELTAMERVNFYPGHAIENERLGATASDGLVDEPAGDGLNLLSTTPTGDAGPCSTAKEGTGGIVRPGSVPRRRGLRIFGAWPARRGGENSPCPPDSARSPPARRLSWRFFTTAAKLSSAHKRPAAAREESMAEGKNLVGVDIGTSSVKVCQVKETRRGFALQRFGYAPLPPQTI